MTTENTENKTTPKICKITVHGIPCHKAHLACWVSNNKYQSIKHIPALLEDKPPQTWQAPLLGAFFFFYFQLPGLDKKKRALKFALKGSESLLRAFSMFKPREKL